MKRAIATLIISSIVLALLVSWAQRGDAATRARHTCVSPCVITFGTPEMHEDEVCWDYRGDGTALMWREDPDACPGW